MDIYSPAVLQEMVRIGLPDEFYFTQRYFSQVRTTTDEEIAFDEMVDKYILMPFVMPNVTGKPIVGSGYTTKRFKPAYMQAEDAIRPANLSARAFGEQINSVPDKLARMNNGRMNILEAHTLAVRRTIEWMCSQYLIYGKYTVSGPDYPTVILDFGRAAGNTIVNSGAALWTAPTTATPLSDIQAANTQIFSAGKCSATEVTMSPEDWALFTKTTEVKDNWKLFQPTGGPLPNISPQAAQKVQLKGSFGDFTFVVYNDFYEVGSSQVRYLNPGTVLVASPEETGLGGRQLYAGIQNLNAIAERRDAQPIYQYEYMTPNGKAQMLATESAPLVAARKVNACAALTVR